MPDDEEYDDYEYFSIRKKAKSFLYIELNSPCEAWNNTKKAKQPMFKLIGIDFQKFWT